MHFEPCDTVQCIDVILKDDCIVEEIESFDLLLTTPSYVDERIMIDLGNGRIYITDNDGRMSRDIYASAILFLLS